MTGGYWMTVCFSIWSFCIAALNRLPFYWIHFSNFFSLFLLLLCKSGKISFYLFVRGRCLFFSLLYKCHYGFHFHFHCLKAYYTHPFLFTITNAKRVEVWTFMSSICSRHFSLRRFFYRVVSMNFIFII